jgi:hypothetical protein
MQAYRGPITKETLQFLFSTGAITKQTYGEHPGAASGG